MYEFRYSNNNYFSHGCWWGHHGCPGVFWDHYIPAKKAEIGKVNEAAYLNPTSKYIPRKFHAQGNSPHL